MIQNNEGLNTSRMVANNGQDFIEGTTAVTGVWHGFMPHNSACKLEECTVTNSDGDTINQAHADLSGIVGTTLDLDSFCGAPPIMGTNSKILLKGYFTSIKLSAGGATAYRDTLSK